MARQKTSGRGTVARYCAGFSSFKTGTMHETEGAVPRRVIQALQLRAAFECCRARSRGLIYNTFSNYSGRPGIGPCEPSDRTIDLLPGHMITLNRAVRHRTRTIDERTVNLTFERTGAQTDMLAAPRK